MRTVPVQLRRASRRASRMAPRRGRSRRQGRHRRCGYRRYGRRPQWCSRRGERINARSGRAPVRRGGDRDTAAGIRSSRGRPRGPVRWREGPIVRAGAARNRPTWRIAGVSARTGLGRAGRLRQQDCPARGLRAAPRVIVPRPSPRDGRGTRLVSRRPAQGASLRSLAIHPPGLRCLIERPVAGASLAAGVNGPAGAGDGITPTGSAARGSRVIGRLVTADRIAVTLRNAITVRLLATGVAIRAASRPAPRRTIGTGRRISTAPMVRRVPGSAREPSRGRRAGRRAAGRPVPGRAGGVPQRLERLRTRYGLTSGGEGR